MKNCMAELRKARGWSKVELADRLSVSRRSIHAIESGKYDPSLPLALAIGKLYGKPVEEIFGENSARRR